VQPPPPNELQTVASLRLALRRFLAATDEVTAAHGLTPRQYDLLALLHSPTSGDRSHTATTIARELSLSRSATTELLTRAASAGLIVRGADPENRRIKQITPTEEGSRRFFSAVAALRDERTRLFELLRVAAGLAATLSTVS